jgi:hypothetical protein
MTGKREGTGAPQRFTDEELARIGDHLTELRRWASEPLILYGTLAICLRSWPRSPRRWVPPQSPGHDPAAWTDG